MDAQNPLGLRTLEYQNGDEALLKEHKENSENAPDIWPMHYSQSWISTDINNQIALHSGLRMLNTNDISDGYHTFGELYEHRIELFITLCRVLKEVGDVQDPHAGIRTHSSPWRSKQHSDGSTYEGWFIMGINSFPGQQITYHLPISKWEECSFAETLDKAPDFDGHTSADVLERLKQL